MIGSPARPGEESAYHKRPSTSHRTLWFDLGEQTYPRMFIPEITWRVLRAVWSDVEAVSVRQFYFTVPDDGLDEKLLSRILSSRMVWLMCELRGRWSEGQEMSRSEKNVYEVEGLRCWNWTPSRTSRLGRSSR